LLVELLKKSPNARIINVSSVAHIRGEIQFDDIHMDKNYTSTGAYAQSKLANVLFSRELAKRLSNSNTNIKVYCLHPGLINTDLQRHLTGLLAFAYKLLKRIVQIDAELGAQTTLYCALSSSEESGHYYKYDLILNYIFLY
jgi:NAD(P)-dependent dehydrogenase (short-subunit alcohol dehydrogenase family)